MKSLVSVHMLLVFLASAMNSEILDCFREMLVEKFKHHSTSLLVFFLLIVKTYFLFQKFYSSDEAPSLVAVGTETVAAVAPAAGTGAGLRAARWTSRSSAAAAAAARARRS